MLPIPRSSSGYASAAARPGSSAETSHALSRQLPPLPDLLSPFGNSGISSAALDHRDRSLPSLRSLNILPTSSSSDPSSTARGAYPAYQDISGSPGNHHVRPYVRMATTDVRNTSHTARWRRDSEMDYSGDGPRPSSSTSAASSLASMTSSDTSFSTNTASSEHAMIGSSQAGWSKDTLSHRPTYRTPSSSDDHQTFKSLQQPFLPSNHSVGQVPPLHVGERRPSSPFPTSKTPTSTSFLRRDSESVRPTSHDALSHTSVSQPTLHRSTSRSNLDISDRYWQQDGQAKHPSSPTTYSAHRDLFSITSTGRGDRLISQPVSTMPFRRVYKDYSQTHQVEQGANTSPRRNLSSSNTQPVYNPYFPLQQIDPSSTPASASSTRLPSHGLSLSPDSHTDRTRTPGLSSTSRVSCKSNSRSPGILGLPRQDLPVQTARSPASQSFIASRSSMAPNTEYRPQYDLEVKTSQSRKSRGSDIPLPEAERPFACTGCSRTFTRRYDRNRHARKHTGEKPYVCENPDCGIDFVRPDALQRHYRTNPRCGDFRHRPL